MNQPAPPPEKAGRKHDGRFAKGASGNPRGKSKGSRHRVTQAVEALMEGEAEALTRKAIEMGLAGDLTALRLCLDRIAPARRERLVSVNVTGIIPRSGEVKFPTLRFADQLVCWLAPPFLGGRPRGLGSGARGRTSSGKRSAWRRRR